MTYGDDRRYAVVATGENFADALSAAPLAAAADAPILLTWRDVLPSVVLDELRRLRTEEILLVGGPGAVSDHVRAQLATVAPVTRLFGADRVETAAAVAWETYRMTAGNPAVGVVVSADAYADALSAGSITMGGVPLVLTHKGSIPASSLDVLQRHARVVYVVGGTGVISSNVVQQLRDAGIGDVYRLAGNDRYGTSAAVLEHVRYRPAVPFSIHGDRIVFATGANYPDALTFGPAARRLGAYVAIVPPTDMADAPQVTTFLEDHAESLDLSVVAGGPGALPDPVLEQLEHAMHTGA